MAKKISENNADITFEDALKKLEETADKINDGELPLDEAIKLYEEGIKSYNLCNKILEDTKQKIEVVKDRQVDYGA